MKRIVSLLCLLAPITLVSCSNKEPAPSVPISEGATKEEERKPETIPLSSIPEAAYVSYTHEEVVIVVSTPKPLLPEVLDVVRVQRYCERYYNGISRPHYLYTDMIIPKAAHLSITKGDRVRVKAIQMLSEAAAEERAPNNVLLYGNIVYPPLVYYSDTSKFRCFHRTYVAVEVVK